MEFIGVVIRRRLAACPITTVVSRYHEIDAEGIEADREVQRLSSEYSEEFPGWTITITAISKFEFEAAKRRIDSIP